MVKPIRSHAFKIATILMCYVTFSAVQLANAADDYESGDPRSLTLDEVRALRDALLRVTITDEKSDPATRTDSLFEKLPATPRARLLDRDSAQARYHEIDDYMALREAEAFHDLGLKAWTADFSDGPLQLWYEVETQGDVQTPDFLLRELTEELKITLNCDAKAGRIIFWVLPQSGPDNNSPRSQSIMSALQRVGSNHEGIAHSHGLLVLGRRGIEFASEGAFRGPRLWAAWHEVDFKQHPHSQPANPLDEATLLDIEALETTQNGDNAPRSVRIKLRAKPKAK